MLPNIAPEYGMALYPLKFGGKSKTLIYANVGTLKLIYPNVGTLKLSKPGIPFVSYAHFFVGQWVVNVL